MPPSSRERYRRFSDASDALPLFLRAWWLDATCGPEGWDAALVEHDNAIVGVLPYSRRERFGMVLLGQPMLTQYLGPWLSEATATDFGRAKDVMGELLAALPPYARYSQNWNPAISNWLPFHWGGFQQTTRYTMQLSNLENLDDVWRALQANARTDVRKATGRFAVRLRENPSLAEFRELASLTFARQGKQLPYSEQFLAALDAACAARNCRRIFIAEDAQGRAHAGAYVVWDAATAWYLIGGGDPSLRNSGATSFCIWEAIRFASTVSRCFDFEGSMIEPIERFFRSFGASHVPYFHVSRTRSTLLRWREALAAGLRRSS